MLPWSSMFLLEKTKRADQIYTQLNSCEQNKNNWQGFLFPVNYARTVKYPREKEVFVLQRYQLSAAVSEYHDR